jgi:hypothetical protein
MASTRRTRTHQVFATKPTLNKFDQPGITNKIVDMLIAHLVSSTILANLEVVSPKGTTTNIHSSRRSRAMVPVMNLHYG